MEASRRKIEHCGAPDEMPGCKVKFLFLYQILRGFPKQQVFAQTLLGFETASADPRFAGINYVMPEDGTVSMADYALHMKIVGFLHGLYPKVRISLHAGELAPGLVPPEGLCCHIRLAVEEGHAERIGHGVDVMHEDRPYDLLEEMAAKHVMVEINLTSNDGILDVSGKDHPFPVYRKFHVPVALSSDDEGVSRIDLTNLRAQLRRPQTARSRRPRACVPSRGEPLERAGRVRARGLGVCGGFSRRDEAIAGLRCVSARQRPRAAAVGTRAPLPGV
jgi:adenosine deaminase